MNNIIEVRNLSKVIENEDIKIEILNNISFNIKENEYVAIMGRSGSGKSTLLSILSGLDDPTSGEVFIDGTCINNLNDNELTEFRNKEIGIVFQSFNLIKSLNALENIQVPLFFSKQKIDFREKSLEMIKLIGLYDKSNTFPKQLSGGEQQRIAIARALSTCPKILFADEPTGALDSKTSHDIMKILKDFRERYKMTIILVTHDKNIAMEADRILYIEDGELNEKK